MSDPIQQLRETPDLAVEALGLTAIKARLDAATPAPWGLTYGVNERTRLWSDATGYTDDVIALDPTTERGTPSADMEFIAHAPTDIAALVARVEELEALLAAIRDHAALDQETSR
ncbi:hypothetical protein GCM10027418_06420 [Mariniluteicoccus endophyticus]